MKNHIIRAVLYEDMSVKWKNAEELKEGVNVHLNVHQKARQFVEVELGDFLLSDGEWILAAFEKSVDGETNHINPTAMDKLVVEGKTVFRLRIPTLVHNTPGKWELYFYLVTNYNPATGEYTDSYPFDSVSFSEYSSFFDDGLTIPSKENLNAVYNEATAALSSAEEALTTAEDAIIKVQKRESSALNNIKEAKDAAVGKVQNEEQESLKEIQDEKNKSLTAIEDAGNLLLGVGADVEKSAIAARQSADEAERRAVAAHDAKNDAVKAASVAERAANEAAIEAARETMNSVGLILRGALGQPTFFIREGRLFVRIIKGSVNPYRIENGRLKMTIVKEVI